MTLKGRVYFQECADNTRDTVIHAMNAKEYNLPMLPAYIFSLNRVPVIVLYIDKSSSVPKAARLLFSLPEALFDDAFKPFIKLMNKIEPNIVFDDLPPEQKIWMLSTKRLEE